MRLLHLRTERADFSIEFYARPVERVISLLQSFWSRNEFSRCDFEYSPFTRRRRGRDPHICLLGSGHEFQRDICTHLGKPLTVDFPGITSWIFAPLQRERLRGRRRSIATSIWSGGCWTDVILDVLEHCARNGLFDARKGSILRGVQETRRHIQLERLY